MESIELIHPQYQESNEAMQRIVKNRAKRLFESNKIVYIETKKVQFIDYIFVNLN